jgi:hypothetical protein
MSGYLLVRFLFDAAIPARNAAEYNRSRNKLHQVRQTLQLQVGDLKDLLQPQDEMAATATAYASELETALAGTNAMGTLNGETLNDGTLNANP